MLLFFYYDVIFIDISIDIIGQIKMHHGTINQAVNNFLKVTMGYIESYRIM